MRLDVTVVPGPSAPGFAPAEVTVTGARACSVPDGGSGTSAHGAGHGGIAVAAALEARWPGTPFTVCGRPLNSLSPGVYPLVSGAVLVAGGTGADRGAGRGATVVLAVLSGPGSGAVFPLRRGVHRLGRGRNGITIADPALSRLHGTVTVGEESITLAPAHPSSGFSIRRAAASHPTASPERVHGPCLVAVGDVIACGQTSFTLRMPPLPETDARAPLVADRISSTGTAAMDQGAAGRFAPIIVPRHQGSARGRLGMLAMAVLPLLFGVGFAWLTGSWMFLAFAGMSAVSVATPLLGGSRRRRQFRVDLASAAVRDAARRLAAFPDAAALILHQDCASPPPRPAATRDTPGGIPGSRPPGPGSPGSTSGVPSLRVGTAVQPALVRVAPDDPSFTPPALPSMPVTVCLPAAGLEIVGPAGLRRPLLNFLLMQLAASGIPVVVFGDPAALPLSARFLPLTVLAACAADVVAAVDELSEVGPDGPFPGLTVLLCLGPCTALDGLPWTGRPPVVIHCGPHPSQQAAAAVTLAIDGMTGHVSGLDFVPDGVPDAIFDRFARSAGLRASAAGKAVGLAPSTMPPPERSNGPAIVHDWQTNRGGPLAAIRLGRAADGDELFDFGRDGPHLLIAGTTGSGKSELLRTLVGGLALSHPPSELSFIFFDFKGGAGLGPLQKLPHTSCLITDLAGHGMERTLASLRTEILRREALLGRVEAADLDDYRRRAADAVRAPCPQAMQTLAHLVVVVDEFRVLVDQFPDSMAELMRLASVGRSLGIHLVLATQRPQGAVNADIRANVTTSICLRVQSALDSQDVIGTAGAAAIPVAKPGRAFISRPGGPPSAFHTATLRLGAETASAAEATVYPTLELLSARSRLGHPGVEGAGAPQPERPLPSSDIDSVAGLLMSAWQLWMDDGGEAAAPHVVAPPLPVTVAVQAMELDATEADGGRVLDELPHGGDDPAGALAAAASPDGRVPGSAGDAATATKPRALVLGLLDVPESQALRPLAGGPINARCE